MKPNVGMVYPVAALIDNYTPNTGITYENGFVVAEARGATLTWEGSDGEFYGDDTLLDSDVGILGYTLDFEPSGLKSDVRVALLGEKEMDNDVIRVTGSGSPDVGFGYIRVMREDNSGVVDYSYEAWWFYKLKFSISSEETRTKERSIDWRVPTLSGRGAGVYLDSDGDITYADHKDFDSMADAKAWLNTMAGISTASTTPATTT